MTEQENGKWVIGVGGKHGARVIEGKERKDFEDAIQTRLTLCNALYAAVTEAHQQWAMSLPAYMMVKAALMLIESAILPRYSFYSIDEAKNELDNRYNQWSDDDVPF